MMNHTAPENAQLSPEAFLAYRSLGGAIRERCLEILGDYVGSRVATKEDIAECYWRACQEVLNRQK